MQHRRPDQFAHFTQFYRSRPDRRCAHGESWSNSHLAPTWPGEVLLRITANVPIRERGLLMPPTTTLIWTSNAGSAAASAMRGRRRCRCSEPRIVKKSPPRRSGGLRLHRGLKCTTPATGRRLDDRRGFCRLSFLQKRQYHFGQSASVSHRANLRAGSSRGRQRSVVH
jgi:hypothetical protein